MRRALSRLLGVRHGTGRIARFLLALPRRPAPEPEPNRRLTDEELAAWMARQMQDRFTRRGWPRQV